MEISYRTEIKTVEEVKKELDQHNKYVDVWEDAMAWLTEVTKDKLDKKATKSILDKWETTTTSGHNKKKYINEELGWEIYMGDSPYDSKNCNMIYINVCTVEYYTTGERYLNPVKNFYTGQFEYPKGSTWAEVFEVIHKYVQPKKFEFDDYCLERVWRGLSYVVKELQELESFDNTYNKHKGYYILNRFIKRQ